jgi:hypothetical protein
VKGERDESVEWRLYEFNEGGEAEPTNPYLKKGKKKEVRQCSFAHYPIKAGYFETSQTLKDNGSLRKRTYKSVKAATIFQLQIKMVDHQEKNHFVSHSLNYENTYCAELVHYKDHPDICHNLYQIA